MIVIVSITEKTSSLYVLIYRSLIISLPVIHLSVPHAKKDCKDCHASKFIGEPKLKNKKNTYLGVKTECLNCHNDYHLRTLSSDCLTCHTPETFVPASKFSHDNAKFKLAGKHRSVECVKCHKINNTRGRNSSSSAVYSTLTVQAVIKILIITSLDRTAASVIVKSHSRSYRGLINLIIIKQITSWRISTLL